jgi:hypothetical protein
LPPLPLLPPLPVLPPVPPSFDDDDDEQAAAALPISVKVSVTNSLRVIDFVSMWAPLR